MNKNNGTRYYATINYKSLKEKHLYKEVKISAPMPENLEERKEIENKLLEKFKELAKEWKIVGFDSFPYWYDLEKEIVKIKGGIK